MCMKKLFLILLLLLVGCNKQEDKIEINYDNSYYQVATPYKESIGSYSIRDYDKEEVESMLMKLSTEYFKTNNSLYQEGQYLTSEEIKQLVTDYNNTEEIKVDDVTIKPSYITTIYEQDYLATNNVLKGISLAIVVDNKQYYDNNYKIVDEKIVLDYALSKVNSLISYVRSKEELKKVDIVVGIYLENDYKGSFKYLGYTNSNSIKMEHVNYNYQLLESNYVMTNDNKTYNTILAIKNSLSDYNLYMNSYGLYQNKTLNEVSIILNKNYFKKSEILDISKILTTNLNNFSNIDIKIYFKNNNNTKAFINKNRNDTKIETYILED